ncbi:MAG: LytTR family DNA-binding domain-containing protein [Clostridiales bacterium]|nr:LytTR family DNA-binding domain-containing protein [Clostridiales bacterium]
MKVDIKKVFSKSDERAEIHVVTVTEEIQSAVDLLENNRRSIPVINTEETVMCPLDKVYYIESVDKRTFVYTKNKCFETRYRLYELEGLLSYEFFRCSKSMIINVKKIASVKAEFNARLRAFLLNGEEVIISRNYVKDLKGKLGLM